MNRTTRWIARAGVCVLALAAPATPTSAQDQPQPEQILEQAQTETVEPSPSSGMGAPELSPLVERAAGASFLTDDERRDLRVFHGIWTPEDLDTPTRLARAALLSGAWNHPALASEQADPLDRAEALIELGREEAARQLIGDDGSPRAVHLRGLSHYREGQLDEAERALEGLETALRRSLLDSAPALTHATRGLALLTRIRGPEGGAGDHQAMMALLATARQRHDRLHWPAVLVEAELLAEKDNLALSMEALQQALSLNPRSARAWGLLGELMVQQFRFDEAERVADQMQADAALLPGVGPDEPPALATEVLAMARLRQRDPADGETLLASALERHPDRPELRALRAASAACRFEFERADAILETMDERSPGASLGPYWVGKSLAEARQYGPAASYLEEAVRREPNHAAALIELGLLELQAGRDGRAVDALRRATALDPFNVRADNSLRLVEEILAYERVESEHFVVRHKPGTDGVLAREMLPVLERIHERVCGASNAGIDHEPAQRTIIELMPDHAWFAVRITGMPRIHTIAAATGPVIAMESPRQGPGSSGVYDWPRVIQHEYVHTVTLSRTNNRIPHWFTEAAAVHLEDAPRDFQRASLLASRYLNDGLFNLEQINIAFVRPEKPSDRAMAYAQGHWMYEFIVTRWGDGAPLALMDRYASGQTEHVAMPEVLGLEPDEFLAEFHAWAGDELLAWGMRLPEGVPSVKRLQRLEAARLAQDAAIEHAEEHGQNDPADVPNFVPEINDEDLPELTEEFADRMLLEHPDHPDLLRLKIDRWLRRAERPTPEMVPLLNRYARARPVDPRPHELLAQMHLAGTLTDPAGAVAPLEFLDAREQKSAVFAVELARRYAALGDWARAHEKATRATRVAPFDADYREFAAAVAIKAGRTQDAERHLVALTELEPDRAQHRVRLEALRSRG